MCWICRGVGVNNNLLHRRLAEFVNLPKGKQSVIFEPGEELNQGSIDTYNRENLLSKPILVDGENRTNATFDFKLADYLSPKLYKRELTVYIDKKGILGDSKVTKKEKKHIKRQLAIVEAEIDKATGNAFDIITTSSIKDYYDFSFFHSQNIRKLAGQKALGVWMSDRSAVAYQRAYGGKKEYKYKLSAKDIKETISHEIGHVFGLMHPLGEYGAKHKNTIMGGYKFTSTLLTHGDLNFLGRAWKDTFKFTKPEINKVNTQSPANFTRTSLHEKPLLLSGEENSIAIFNFNNADYMTWYKIRDDRILTYYIDEMGSLGNIIKQNNSQHIEKQLEIVEATIDSATNNAFDIVRVDDSASADINFISSTNREGSNAYLSNWNIVDSIVNFKENNSWPVKSDFRLNDRTINQAISREIGHIFGLDRPISLLPGNDMSSTIMAGSDLTSEFLTDSDLQVLSLNWANTIDFMGF